MTKETIAEAVEKAVHTEAVWKHAGLYGKPGYRGIKVEQVKADVWMSPEGQALAALLRSPYAKMPVEKARTEIRKGAVPEAMTKALEVLRDGFPGR